MAPRSGKLQSVPVYMHLKDCDATSDPPQKEASSAARKKTTIATPPYPWLMPQTERPSTKVATVHGSATDPAWAHLGARAGSLQLEHLLTLPEEQRNRLFQQLYQANGLDVQPGESASSSTRTAPAPPRARSGTRRKNSEVTDEEAMAASPAPDARQALEAQYQALQRAVEEQGMTSEVTDRMRAQCAQQ